MTDEQKLGPGEGQDTADELRKAVEARIIEEEEKHPAPSGGNGKNKIKSRFIEQCLNANELGDGLLYAAMHRDKFFWNNTAEEWFLWKGHTWQQDIMCEHLASVENVVDRIIEEAGEISGQIDWAVKKGDTDSQKMLEHKRDAIYKRVSRYRTDRGRTAMLKFARTCLKPLAIRGNELDLNPWLLACPNGVIDLRSGKFRDGRTDEYISKCANIEWKGLKEPREPFEKWLVEIFEGDEKLIAFLQRVLGYAITGLDREHIFIVFHGPEGRNGKGTLVKLLNYVLGDHAGAIPAEMLLDQGRTKSSSGPSPDILLLKGLRIAFASETDQNRHFSPAKVKWLTGGDELVGRNLNEKNFIHFDPTHTLFLLTNHLPHAPDTDSAFWERIHIIPFNLSFVRREPIKPSERRADIHLGEKLKACGSGILAWLVEGCLKYQAEGLNPPKTVTEYTAHRRSAENDLADFFEDYCRLDDSLKEKATILYDNFNRWFKKNKSKKGITQTKFGRTMGQRFEKTKVKGVVYYLGIELVKDVEEEKEDDD